MPEAGDRRRRALVTGGGQGIGAAVARRLTADGFTVVVVDVHGDAATRIADEVDGEAYALDVRDIVAAEHVLQRRLDVDLLDAALEREPLRRPRARRRRCRRCPR